MSNIAAYVGALINGFVGAIACCIAIYVPAFLTIWAVVPYWQLYRTNQKVQRIIYGLCCASIGFILASVMMLWISVCYNKVNYVDTFLNTSIAAGAFYLLQYRKFSIPDLMLAGGLKFLMKHLLFGL
jgi:chromate transporter